MPNQSHGSALWREPAGSGAVPSAVPVYFVNAPVSMVLDYGPGTSWASLGGTFARAGVATYTDINGVVQYVASGVMREWCHYVGAVGPGTLLEGASTNLCKQSARLDNAAFFRTGTVGTGTASATAPDGTISTLSQLQMTTSADTVGQNATISGATAGSIYTVSVWLRLTPGGAGSGSVTLRCAEAGGAGGQAQTDVVIQPTAQWQRFTVTRTFVNNDRTIAQLNILGRVALSDVQAWGAQVEKLPVATSYIPTTSAAVTRPDELAQLPWTYAQQAETGYIKYVELGTALTAPSRLFQVGGPGDPRWIVNGLTGSNVYRTYLNNSQSGALAAPSYGQSAEVRSTIASNGVEGLGIALNGGAETVTNFPGPVTAFGTPTTNALALGNIVGGGSGGYAMFLSVRFAMGVWTLRQMQKLDMDPNSVMPSTTGPERYAAYDVAQDGNYTLLDLTPVYLVSDGAGGYQPSTTGPALAILIDDGAGGITVSSNLALAPIADLYFDTGGNLWVVRRVCNRLHAVQIGSNVFTY